ncbi:LysR family transcriptional regulator [Bacillus sp. B1-b2]|uniref:LysR family transcriptional regulator n=1 Tax=Bacillus sp. B1-b2 TaxID=2653201 RepID=UPI001261EF00|nr:LysR family transcriptional regulator [Bacillus sp. B1-b2]KAB7673211.1 LysR family transcriptional regulator [Bacillus sp. B1-b2]
MLNTWRLQLLVQFETLGTMQRVAEVMYISTATVSQQLNLLEKETQTILFEKKGRKVQLTHAGYHLVKQVRPILHQLEKIENSFNDTSDAIQGTIRIASFSSALRHIVIPAIAKVEKKHPLLTIQLTEMEPDESLPALDSHQFDLAVVAYFEKNQLLIQKDRSFIELGTDNLKILIGNNNPLKIYSSIKMEDLMEENWVMEPEGTYLSEYTRTLCRNAGYQPNVKNVFLSYSTMQAVVANNLAIAVLPKLAISKHTDGIHLLDLIPKTSRHIFLVARKPQMSLRAIQLVSEAIKEQAEKVITND